MNGHFSLYWDQTESGSVEAILQLQDEAGKTLGNVSIEDALPPDCRQCATNPHKVGELVKALYHWLAPASFIDEVERQSQGATKDNPAQIDLPAPDLTHFGLIQHGKVDAVSVQALIKLLGEYRDRLPMYGALHELVGRGYSMSEAADVVNAHPDMFFASNRSAMDTEAFRFYEAIKPDEWELLARRLSPTCIRSINGFAGTQRIYLRSTRRWMHTILVWSTKTGW